MVDYRPMVDNIDPLAALPILMQSIFRPKTARNQEVVNNSKKMLTPKIHRIGDQSIFRIFDTSCCHFQLPLGKQGVNLGAPQPASIN